ncbi:mRNA N(3)-methylcytidine methyltransferase METTL8 isoform X3 [Varanus komodoensis]|nr:mRNA N(3)-methylcytidine methyltransferase METTL8 isoform X3 [Varanus komodoensis]
MQWSREEEERAREKAVKNSLVRVCSEMQDKYENDASKYWNEFYKTHKNRFFKDRNWLFLEFPEILPEGKYNYSVKMDTTTKNLPHFQCTGIPEDKCLCEDNSVLKVSSAHGNNFSPCYDYSAADDQSAKCFEKQFPGSDAAYRILEVGCGAGNSVFPVLKAIRQNPRVFLYCCDFASGAVELIKLHSCFDASRCFAFVHNVCDDASPYPFPDESLDVVLLVFVLSSIHPDRDKHMTHVQKKGLPSLAENGEQDRFPLCFLRSQVRPRFLRILSQLAFQAELQKPSMCWWPSAPSSLTFGYLEGFGRRQPCRKGLKLARPRPPIRLRLEHLPGSSCVAHRKTCFCVSTNRQ